MTKKQLCAWGVNT